MLCFPNVRVVTNRDVHYAICCVFLMPEWLQTKMYTMLYAVFS